MCLAVPGRIIEVRGAGESALTEAAATVDFQGTRLEVSLAFTPEAAVGDWVLVHAGFALNVLDEREAMETWRYLEEAGLADMPAEMQTET
jgi:hydrogenase expression/formation protein HypC